MKIKKIVLQNNAFFGNKKFLFIDSQGNIMDNIVLAGENGCGKTQILNLIYDFSTLSLHGIVSDEIRIFTVVLSEDELNDVLQNVGDNINLISPTGEMEITQDFSAQNSTWARIRLKYQSRDLEGNLTLKKIEPSWFFNSINIKRLFRSIFSTVEINYNPKKATNITAKEIDEKVESSIQSGTDLATEIQQLLIDIQANDANDLYIWVENHAGEVPPDEIKSKRINRFKNAFSTIFQNLNYSKIVTDGENKKVIFKKDTHDIEISSLSSGEKQIVFRGAFLLRNQQTSQGCCILIDEPEISLHPIWQGKIFNYYRKLFVSENGSQTSQLFIATHSQYVLRSALENSANTLILLLNNNSGTIECKSITAPLVLPSITSAELNYIAFDLVSNDYHIELYGHLQNKIALSRGIQKCSVKACDTYIANQADYDATKHHKPSSHTTTHGTTTYDTLPTFIRNAIDHPDPARTFTQEELRISIELLIELCR